MRTCPACAETIADTGDYCPHCGVNVRYYDLGYSQDDATSSSTGKSMSIVMLLTLVAAGVGAVTAALLCIGYLTCVTPITATQRMQCRNNLKQIGLALHSYHDVYGVLPPAYIADEAGKPMHSWRVLILPYLDEAPLYKEYRFDEPWDGPHNSTLLSRCPQVYRCPSSKSGNASTPYLAVSGEHAAFGLGKSVSFRDFADGLSNTILVGEADQPAVPWMQPTDINANAADIPIGEPGGFNSPHVGGFHVLMGDGAVRFISQNISPDTFRALLTRDGGEIVGEY